MIDFLAEALVFEAQPHDIASCPDVMVPKFCTLNVLNFDKMNFGIGARANILVCEF